MAEKEKDVQVEDEVEAAAVEAESDTNEESAEAENVIEADPLFLAREEAEMHKDRWMRLAAEFDNYKKRTAREFETLVQSANEDLIKDLLPVLDGVGRALAHSAEGDTDTDAYQEGVKMIMEQFPRVLENRNLKEIETVGQVFDPNVHEALMQMPSEDYDAGVVADVIEKGYCLGEKVLRPAKVVVSQGKPQEAENKSE